MSILGTTLGGPFVILALIAMLFSFSVNSDVKDVANEDTAEIVQDDYYEDYYDDADEHTANRNDLYVPPSKRDDDEKDTAGKSHGEVYYVTDKTFDKEVLEYDGFVLVDFYATWCGPCMYMAPSIEKIAEDHPEYKIVEVDVDSCTSVSTRYNIVSIPTLMFVKDGEIKYTSVGALEESDILSLIDAYK